MAKVRVVEVDDGVSGWTVVLELSLTQAAAVKALTGATVGTRRDQTAEIYNALDDEPRIPRLFHSNEAIYLEPLDDDDDDWDDDDGC